MELSIAILLYNNSIGNRFLGIGEGIAIYFWCSIEFGIAILLSTFLAILLLSEITELQTWRSNFAIQVTKLRNSSYCVTSTMYDH